MNNYCINTLPLHNNVHNSDSTIIIKTTWHDQFIEINLFLTNEKTGEDKRNGFTGIITTLNLSITAKALEIDWNEFIEETKSALCTQNGLPNFIYYLETDRSSTSQSATFKWCKSTAQGIKINYGLIILQESPGLVDKMMIDSIRINEKKDQKIEMQKQEIQRIKDDFTEMKRSLEKCVNEKNQLEGELFKKFAALLNSKKDKIVELERALKNRSSVEFEYESDGSGDDSDLEYSSQYVVRTKSPIPSTSHQDNNSGIVLVPKRSKTTRIAEETFVNVKPVQPNHSTDSTDIYDRETEVLMEDM